MADALSLTVRSGKLPRTLFRHTSFLYKDHTATRHSDDQVSGVHRVRQCTHRLFRITKHPLRNRHISELPFIRVRQQQRCPRPNDMRHIRADNEVRLSFERGPAASRRLCTADMVDSSVRSRISAVGIKVRKEKRYHRCPVLQATLQELQPASIRFTFFPKLSPHRKHFLGT